MITAAPAAARNAAPIIEVLRRELSVPCRLLEIGSGTGLHAVRVSEAMPGITWQATEVDAQVENLRLSLRAVDEELADRVRALDVDQPVAFNAGFDAIFSCNTAHIMALDSVENMFRCVAESGLPECCFLLYGPFRLHDDFTSPSNAVFDETLRRQDPRMGIRDLETLDEFAGAHEFTRTALYAMPSNNLLPVWRRQPG